MAEGLQASFHRHVAKKSSIRCRDKKPAMLTLSLLPGDRLLAPSSSCPFTSSLSVFSTLFFTSFLLLSPPARSFFPLHLVHYTHTQPSQLPALSRPRKVETSDSEVYQPRKQCAGGCCCKASQGDWRRGGGGRSGGWAPLSLTSSAE